MEFYTIIACTIIFCGTSLAIGFVVNTLWSFPDMKPPTLKQKLLINSIGFLGWIAFWLNKLIIYVYKKIKASGNKDEKD